MEGARRSGAALKPGNGPRIIAAHPDAGGEAARKSNEPPILVGCSGSGFAGDRAADLRRAAGARENRRLEQVGHFGGDPWGDEHALLGRVLLVKQAPVGRDDLADPVRCNRDALVGDGGEGASHLD